MRPLLERLEPRQLFAAALPELLVAPTAAAAQDADVHHAGSDAAPGDIDGQAAGTLPAASDIRFDNPADAEVDAGTDADARADAIAIDLAGAVEARSASLTAAAAVLSLRARADALVRDGAYAGTNFGSAGALEVRLSSYPGNRRESYLRFDLSSVASASQITSAKVRLYGRLSEAGSMNVGLFPVAGSGWTESGLAWSNKPGSDPAAAGSRAVAGTVSGWHEFDVTGYLKQRKQAGAATADLHLRATTYTPAHAVFASDEAAANRPELRVTQGTADAPTAPDPTVPPPPPPPPPTGSTTVSFRSTADAHVRDGVYASENFAAATGLEVRLSSYPDNWRESFLRFDLSGVGSAAQITSAKVRLYGRLSEPGGVNIGLFPLTTGTGWTETGVTWSDHPLSGTTAVAPLRTLEVTTNSWFEFDVTSYLKQQKAAGAASVSLAVKATNYTTPHAIFASDEAAANRPELRVTQGGTVVPPPPTAPVQPPAPVSTPLRILPLGDSVTAGSGGGAYRRRLFGLLSAAYPGRAIDFVGTASDPASAPLPDRNHEGHGGYAIGELLANLDGDDGQWNNGGGYWLTGTASRPPVVPAVILLHAGTNDVPDPVTPAALRDRLDDLIEKITTLRPNARLLVADPIVRNDSAEAKSAAFGALVPALVAKHAALGRKVTFVDMHSRLTTADLYDSVHPNASGEDKMADTWAAAITAAVPPGAGG